MTNFIKTIRSFVVSTLAAVVLVSPLSAHAAGTVHFNNLPGDAEFLSGRNITRDGAGSASDPVTARPSDVVDVAVYYHNTEYDQATDTGVVAKNVKIKITLPSADARTSHVIKGELSADNGEKVTGTIVNGIEVGKPDFTINTDSSTTLSYVPGSVRWYPERSDTTGAGVNLPAGQNGDSIISTGINLGDVAACFAHSGYIKFKVVLAGTTVPTPVLTLEKEVRRANTDDAFIKKNIVNPTNQLEYRLTVRNIDGQGIAKNVRLKDVLPAGLTYVGPTKLVLGGVTTTLPDGIVSNDGIIAVPTLAPQASFTVTFLVATASTFKNDDCVMNSATATSDNSNAVTSTAQTCFLVPPKSTPTPTPPTPTPPTPVLPHTGPGMELISVLGMSGFAGSVTRQAMLKAKLKKNARSLDIV